LRASQGVFTLLIFGNILLKTVPFWSKSNFYDFPQIAYFVHLFSQIPKHALETRFGNFGKIEKVINIENSNTSQFASITKSGF